MPPDLDSWLNRPTLRVTHDRSSAVAPERLWRSAQAVRVRDTARLGRLIRWRIPGTRPEITFDELFRAPPFYVLEESELGLVSGLVGRIWTLRRDYPQLADPEEFRGWSARGTARVVFAHWVEPAGSGGSRLISEVRVDSIGRQGRLGLMAVRPIVRAFGHLVGSDGIAAAVQRAERS